MPFDSAAVDSLFNKIVSHALKLGLFEHVNTHEPKTRPGNGLNSAIWVDYIGPAKGASGLSSTTGKIVLKNRIYKPMLSKPLDDIDPNILKAVSTLLGEYTGDFDFGVTIRQIDLLGEFGQPLEAQAGYLNMDGTLLRVMTINLPVIINNIWAQAG